MFLKGILSRKEREIIERDTYLRQEYGVEMTDEWCYGNDLTDEFDIEGELLGSTYNLGDFK